MFIYQTIKTIMKSTYTRMFFIMMFCLLLVISSSPNAYAGTIEMNTNLISNNANQTTLELADHMVFIPLALKDFPPIPDAPVLNTINNGDGDGNYTVSWSSVDGGDTYTIQENTSVNFSNPITVSISPGTSTGIYDRVAGTYYYRAQATNDYGDSVWSNIVSATVTLPPSNCPRVGDWVGSTSQGSGYDVSFEVENSPQCQIKTDTLRIEYKDSCDYNKSTTFMYDVPIVNNQFDTGISANTQVIGEFTTPSIISGTFSYDSGSCTASGTWTAGINKGANNSIVSIVVQPDNKILIGGDFTMLGGQERNYLARLHADGTLDADFNPGANATVSVMATQTDGKILIGGYFTEVDGQSRDRIARLNSDGTLDTTFNPGANDRITGLAIQPDGKILVGGSFTTLGGEARDHVARLNADGTLDDTFNPGADSRVYDFAVQSDNKIIIGGFFNPAGGGTCKGICRLNADGTRDATFVGSAYGTLGLEIQPDSKIMIWGYFVQLNGQNRRYIARLDANGNIDPTFSSVSGNNVRSFIQLSDSKLLIGGDFWYLGGVYRTYIGRLNADGTFDSSVNLLANDKVRAIVIQSDGKIIVGGDFTSLGGDTRSYIARLNPDATFDITFP